MGCPGCAGISVQLALESLSSFGWNRCPACAGIRIDRQYALLDNRVGDYLRPVLWQADSASQVYFATTFSQAITKGPALAVSIDVPDLHYFNGRGAKDVIPLYRDANATQPNLHPELLMRLSHEMCSAISEQDWACYLYAVMAHSGYTSKFGQELASKEIRVPITLDSELFKRAAAIGKQLLFLHSHGERFSDDFPRISGSARCSRAVQSNTPIGTFHYDGSRNVLVIGSGEFNPVPPEIWNFEVSGLKVIQSWLGYRMANRSGKKTSPLDDIGLPEWTAELNSELLQLLWILENTLALCSDQADLLDEIYSGELLLANSLGEVPAAFRKAPKSNEDQEELAFE